MNKDLEQKITGLFEAAAEMTYETDMQHGDGRDYWPFHPVLVDTIVSDFVFGELFRICKELEEQNYVLEDFAKLFKSPTRIANYQYLWPTLRNLDKEKRRYLAELFVRLLDDMRNGYPFCEDRKNPVWTEEQVEQFLSQYQGNFVKKSKNQEYIKTASKLKGLLTSYAELLYYYMIDLSRMYHGPYEKGNSILFAKEFLDLEAGEMYEPAKEFPFDRFQEVGVYDKSLKPKVFFMGHTHVNKPFTEVLEKSVLLIDGEPATSLKKLRRIYEQVENVVEGVVSYTNQRRDDEWFLLKHAVDLFFYPLKGFYNEVGEDWKDILPEVYEFAKENKDDIKIPPPWGEIGKERAKKRLVKQMDFRE